MKSFRGFNEANDFEYGCMMLDLGVETSSHVEQMMLNINPDHLHKQTNKIGKRHITVKYGFIEPDIIEGVRSFINDHSELFPMMVKYGGLSLFENEEYDVLILNVEEYENLLRLNGAVEYTFQTTSAFRYYHPHVTIAYLKKGYGKLYTNMLNSLRDTSESFNSVCYSEVDDKEYTIGM